MQTLRGPFAKDKGAAISPECRSELRKLNARRPVHADAAPDLERLQCCIGLPAGCQPPEQRRNPWSRNDHFNTLAQIDKRQDAFFIEDTLVQVRRTRISRHNYEKPLYFRDDSTPTWPR